MPASLQIHSLSTSIDMFGDPDALTAYSLSGHVSLSVSSSLWLSFLDQYRFDKIHLKSLCLTFEGQSEVVGENIGYHAFRVFEVSKELVPTGAELVHNGSGKQKETTWEFLFSLTVPGWLPASRSYCSSYSGPAGTKYFLHAVATFGSIDDGENSAWCMSLPAYLRSGARTVRAEPLGITINRYIQPLDDELPRLPFASAYPCSSYNISTTYAKPITNDSSAAEFPSDILSAIEMRLTQPDRVGIEEGNLAIALRIRAPTLTKEQSSRLKWLGFSIGVVQTEYYRNYVPSQYSSRFPIPPILKQPPNKPLIRTHSMKAMVDACLLDLPSGEKRFERSFSVLSQDPSHHHYKVSGNGLVFSTLNNPPTESDDSSSSSEEESPEDLSRAWYRVQANVPIPRRDGEDDDNDDNGEEASKRLRPTEESPLFSVRHQLRVSLQFAYTSEDGETSLRQLQFSLPLRFAHIPPTSRVSSAASSVTDLSIPLSPYGQTSAASSRTSIGMLDSRPYAPCLPAYSQLFYPNGDRKIDYSTPLPMYSAEPSSLDAQLPSLMEQPELSSQSVAAFQISPKPYRSHSFSHLNA